MRIGLFLLQANSISYCAERSRFVFLHGCLLQRVASRWRELNCFRHVQYPSKSHASPRRSELGAATESNRYGALLAYEAYRPRPLPQILPDSG